MINDHRQWLYHKTEQPRIFEAGEQIPIGWYDSPDFNGQKTRQMWNGQLVTEKKDLAPNEVEEKKEKVTEKPKYPSQMNKTELTDLGADLGISFDESMTARQMRQAINEAVKNHEGD